MVRSPCETIDADADQSLQVRRELSRAWLQRIDDPACAGWFVAHGKERAPHLATEKFHDDRAAESRQLVYVHALLGIRRAAKFCYHKNRRRCARILRRGIPRRCAADADTSRRFQEQSNRITRDHPLRTLVLPR